MRSNGPPLRAALPYNLCMRAATLLLASLLLSATVQAQAVGDPSPPTPVPAPALPADATPADQRIERIRVEDEGSRIDELRVGGETKQITVQPKVGNLPAYEVQPHKLEGADGSNGRRVWRAFQF